MQLIQEKYNIQQSEDFKEVEFDLDKGNKALMIEMLHSNLYSNPIGSVIRELASNCIDAHTEAKITKPIEIEFREKNKFTGDNQPCIIFRDHAGLLSPERFKKTYTQYFASTKRTDNQQIGGYGLGCKTPLAYTDSFNVHVIHDKMDYMYTIQKVGYGDIKLFLMHSEATTENNVTEVIVYLNKPEDRQLFINEIRKQLLYFKNVKYININIQPVIFLEETKDYIISNNTIFVETHLVVGNVPYKLDLATLYPGYTGYNNGLVNFNTQLQSFAIKFEIGELSLSINRENVYYTEDTKKKIKDKLDMLCTSFSKEISDSIKNAKTVIELINTLATIRQNGHLGSKATDILKNKSSFCLYSTNFKPFMYHGYPIEYSFSLFTLFSIRSVKEGWQKSQIDITDLTDTSRFNSIQLNLISPTYYTEKGTLEKRKALSEIRTINSPFILIKGDTVVDAVAFNKTHQTKYTQAELQKYYDLLKAELIANSKDWDTVVTDLSLLDDDDKKAIMSSKEYRKINKLLFVKEVNSREGSYSFDKKYTFKHSSVQSESLDKVTEFVVYGSTDEHDKLLLAASLLECIKKLDSSKVYKVAKDNLEYFEEQKNMKSVTEFFDKDSDSLKQFYTAYKVSEVLSKIHFLGAMEQFNSRIYKIYIKLKDYVANNYDSRPFNSSLFNEVFVFCEKNGVQDAAILAELKEITDFTSGLEIFNYLNGIESGNRSAGLEQDCVIDGICEILEAKKKEITYTVRPMSTTNAAKKEGKTVVLAKFLKLQGITAYVENKHRYDALKKDFYLFDSGEYLYKIMDWINKL